MPVRALPRPHRCSPDVPEHGHDRGWHLDFLFVLKARQAKSREHMKSDPFAIRRYDRLFKAQHHWPGHGRYCAVPHIGICPNATRLRQKTISAADSITAFNFSARTLLSKAQPRLAFAKEAISRTNDAVTRPPMPSASKRVALCTPGVWRSRLLQRSRDRRRKQRMARASPVQN